MINIFLEICLLGENIEYIPKKMRSQQKGKEKNSTDQKKRMD